MTTLANGTLLVFAHREEAHAFAAAGVPHLITGIGLVNASVGLAQALHENEVSKVVVLGTAGMLDDSLDLDTVYRIDEAVQHDFAFASPRAVIHGDGLVIMLNENRAADPSKMVIATGNSFVTDDATRDSMRGQGVQLVDMESYAYAAMCQAFRVKLDIFKVPSDRADSATTDKTWDEIVHQKSEQLLNFARERGLL